MTWLYLVDVLLKFFGPLLAEWLKELLDRAAVRMTASPDHYGAGADLAALFDAAGEDLWWFQFRKKAVLAACRKAAVKRATALRQAANGDGDPRGVPALTPAEVRELATALA